ncbi:MAG: peptidylprolyl isomerase [Fischerella sp. CENA71]|nr:peptidylprolyl isomerase [Fischerella sp. CENA71]
MSKELKISSVDILQQLKLSCQIPELVQAIANRKIVADAANQAGIKVETTELQKAADNLRVVNKLLKAEDTWAWLKKHHLAVEEFELLAETNLLSAKLANHLFADKVEPFFYENQLNYIAAAIYEVVLDDEDLALELFYALKEGEISFAEIARQYIQNPELRRAGGYIGVKTRSELRPEIAAAVFASNPPGVIKPIVTPKGVHLIWVEEIIQPQLNDLVRLKILSDLFANWLKQQSSTWNINVDLDSEYNSSAKELLQQV